MVSISIHWVVKLVFLELQLAENYPSTTKDQRFDQIHRCSLAEKRFSCSIISQQFRNFDFLPDSIYAEESIVDEGFKSGGGLKLIIFFYL